MVWSFEYLHIYHHSRKEIVIIKIDFEKAFDKIEHQAMLTLMIAKGFGQRWLGWMQSIFSSRTSAVLLNGVPRKTFHCKREGQTRRPPLSITFCFGNRLSSVYDKQGQGLGPPQTSNPNYHCLKK